MERIDTALGVAESTVVTTVGLVRASNRQRTAAGRRRTSWRERPTSRKTGGSDGLARARAEAAERVEAAVAHLAGFGERKVVTALGRLAHYSLDRLG